MRFNSLLAIALLITALAFAAQPPHVAAQTDSGQSAIQFAPPEQAAAGAYASDDPPPAYYQQPGQQRPEPNSATPATAPHPRTAPQYTIRQADYMQPRMAAPAGPAPAIGRAPVVNVYASSNAQTTLSKIPQPMTVQPRATTALPQHPRGKPFQSVQSEPAVSPYLNMYRNDVNANNLPNYFAFVRPQLEQQETARQQAAELQKLRGQIQSLSAGNGAAANSANMTSHAHYMDTAQFYRGLHR